MSYKIKVTDKAGASHDVEAHENMSVMEILRDANFVEGVCGGVCACATCHVEIAQNWMTKTGTRNEEEEMLLEELPEMQENSRLACQIPFTSALDGLELVVLDS